ncbi:MAG: sodium/calcium exchanger protein [Bryobacteraceae bacterium]
MHKRSEKAAHASMALALLVFAVPLHQSSPWAALWTVPAILLASLLITWGAESAQFFVAQGFALAILAWMQVLPEFAVEAVLAWRQQTTLLVANLTGALRLLTGLAWPMIYATAAMVHRKRTGHALRGIELSAHHSVEVVGLFLPLVYALVIWYKASLHVYDAVVLTGLYAAYLLLLTRLPPEEREGIEDLESIPRKIVLAPRRWRIFAISACFFIGGVLIYYTAEPFLGSLVAIAAAMGVPSFIVIQWLAPVISEFPEFASTFYFARQEKNASTAIMNIASSNINQWTLLVAMLPVVFSLSRGGIASFSLDDQQRLELLLTIGQSFLGMAFLINMSIAWWEALAMFLLFAAQFVLPAFFGDQGRIWIAMGFFIWTGAAALVIVMRRRLPNALARFLETWRTHVRS